MSVIYKIHNKNIKILSCFPHFFVTFQKIGPTAA